MWMAIAVMMFAAVGHARELGGYFTGDDLLGWCESESLDARNACNAYLAGVVDLDGVYYGRSYTVRFRPEPPILQTTSRAFRSVSSS